MWWGQSLAGLDVRRTLPPDDSFWSRHARGTCQNMVVGKRHPFRQPGRYLFLLGPAPFDMRRVADSAYDLVVTASEIAGM